MVEAIRCPGASPDVCRRNGMAVQAAAMWRPWHNDSYSLKSYFENEEEFTETWENLSEEDAQELKKLEIQSEKEYEQWLKQQKLQEKRKQQEENLRKKMKEDEEKQKTQELLEQMMKAENERRQKLLEDVQNSLQGNDSTNVSSGADDIIDLDYEGELD